MKRHVGLLIALTGIVLIAAVCAGLEDLNVLLRSATVPFALQQVDAHTEAIVALPGVARPQGLRAGNRIDLAAQPLATRLAIVNGGNASQPLPPGQILQFVVQRGPERLSVPVRTVRWGVSISRSARWLRVFGDLCFP